MLEKETGKRRDDESDTVVVVIAADHYRVEDTRAGTVSARWQRSIIHLTCGMRSYNPVNVHSHYCAHCNVFLDD